MYWTKCTQKCQRSPVQTECNYVKRLGHFWITIGGKIISWSNFSEPPNSNCVCSKHRKATAEICVWTVNCATGKESLRSVPFRLQSPALIEVFLESTEKRNCTFANLSLIFTLSHDAIVKAFWRIIGFSIYNRGPKHYFNLFTRLRTMARARPLGIWRRRFSKSAGIPTRLKGLKYFYNCV